MTIDWPRPVRAIESNCASLVNFITLYADANARGHFIPPFNVNAITFPASVRYLHFKLNAQSYNQDKKTK